MRWLHLTLALLVVAVPLGAEPQAPARPRVVVVKTILISPFEEAEASLVRSLQNDMDVYVVPVVPGNPREGSRIAALQPDVVVSIGSQATEWVAQALPSGLPIVFSMVLDPLSGGFVGSLERPGGRITGAALDIPIETQFQTLKEVLAAGRVGVLFNPQTSSATIEAARKIAPRFGVELVPIAVEDRTRFDEALDQIDGSLDAVWAVPDSLVLSKPFSQRLLLHTIRKGIPLMGVSEQHVQAGALFALVTSHEENGRQAADRVRRIVSGELPAAIPVAMPKTLEIVFNARTAESLGVRVSQNSVARVRPSR
jgi:putative ABC transport system substrate-binding protein